MTSWDIIKLVNMAVNRDVNSMAFSPDEYATMINAQSLKLFKVKLGNPDEYRGTPNGQQGVGISKKVDKDLNPFLVFTDKSTSSGVLTLTTENPAFIQTIIPYTQTGRGVDMIGIDELGDRLLNPITAPTLKDPIAYETGVNVYKIVPSSVSRVYIGYYKYPTAVSFTLEASPITLAPVYNGITEVEWNDVCKVDIAYYIIRDAGLNVSRGDVSNMAEQIINSR